MKEKSSSGKKEGDLMENPYPILRERGFIYQSTDETGLTDLFDQERVTAYIGFDATADSLHVGSLIPVMSLAWLQRLGHRPICIVGGGTTMVGDPSGKTEARKLLSREDIARNMEGLKTQLSGYMEFGEDKALMIDNGDWLLDLNYIEFLRDIGRHFSVNKMLAAESYKARLETGLTFIEFNYMLLQSYDFLVLYQRLGNKLQMGGQDQWGNIVAGIDLIRRMTGGQAYGLTFPLLQDPKTGAKFGKTHSGAVWLDGQKTGPWDFFQFWRNTDDAMVEKCLGLFTFLPMDEVRALGRLEGVQINRAKEILAYEVTALRHGHEEAAKAFLASIRTFGASDPEGHIPTSSAVAGLTLENEEDLPAVTVPKARFAEGIQAIECFVLAGLTKSKGEARRLVRGGGAWAGGRRIDDEEQGLTLADLTENALVLRAGKKRYGRILVQ